MKACRGSRGVAPLILNLGIRWRWVVNYMPQLLYPCENFTGCTILVCTIYVTLWRITVNPWHIVCDNLKQHLRASKWLEELQKIQWHWTLMIEMLQYVVLHLFAESGWWGFPFLMGSWSNCVIAPRLSGLVFEFTDLGTWIMYWWRNRVFTCCRMCSIFYL
jgi:hypothetical protein